MTITVGSMFSGIGGIDLGLERAGMRVVWQAEIDPYCCRVLAKHWPDVPNLGDVTTIDWEGVPRVDLVCGGFPCQNVSDAGRLAGIEGEQTGLWAYVADAVRSLRPRYVLVENVTGLLARGFGRVVGDLAACGYDTEWDCIPAAAVGAPHLRGRVWVLAYASGERDEADNRLLPGRTEFGVRPRWLAEPSMARVAYGVSRLMDRVRTLGNAVVPDVAEWVGRRIIEADERAAARTSPADARPKPSDTAHTQAHRPAGGAELRRTSRTVASAGGPSPTGLVTTVAGSDAAVGVHHRDQHGRGDEHLAAEDALMLAGGLAGGGVGGHAHTQPQTLGSVNHKPWGSA